MREKKPHRADVAVSGAPVQQGQAVATTSDGWMAFADVIEDEIRPSRDNAIEYRISALDIPASELLVKDRRWALAPHLRSQLISSILGPHSGSAGLAARQCRS
jgi:hypothetical protein